jgi:DNA-binding transcriptional LysR family regulator
MAARITVRQLEIFRAIFQEQTVTAAARKIGLSQAATSQALAELENLLERKLFDRYGRRIVLNDAGRRLLPAAAEVLDRVRDIETPRADTGRLIRMCASLTIGNYLLPPLMARFTRRNPGCQFQVALGNTDQVAESLLHFASDVGWIEGLVRDPELKAFRWRSDELVIIAHPADPLASRQVTPEQLADAAWVLREKGSGTRAVFESAIAGKFSPARVPLELGGLEAIKLAVLSGGGLGCVSKSAVTVELRSGRLRRVRSPWLDLRRQLTVLVHRRKYIDAGLRAFLRFCGVRIPE